MSDPSGAGTFFERIVEMSEDQQACELERLACECVSDGDKSDSPSVAVHAQVLEPPDLERLGSDRSSKTTPRANIGSGKQVFRQKTTDMFDESDPTPVEFLEGGTIELPRHICGTDAKSILKSKKTACRAPTNLFELNLFQVSNKSGEGSTRGAHTRNTCDAIISTRYHIVVPGDVVIEQ